MLEKNLLKIAEKSTDQINLEKFSYYYQCGKYKFYNGCLAHWYKNKTNKMLTFVADGPIDQIKKQLLDQHIDLNYDYNSDYFKKLKNKNQKLQLFLSGGSDSATILHKASVNNFVFDEIISVIYGPDVEAPENLEIKNNAIPFAEKYKHSYKKFSLLSITEDHLTEYYSDPYVLFKHVNFENTFPYFRQLWNQPTDLDKEIKIFGVDKPQLLFYKDSWYTILLDHQLGSWHGRLSSNNAILFWSDPDNIKSLIKDSITYRNYILKNNLLTNEKLQFFKIGHDSHDVESSVIDRITLMAPQTYKKQDQHTAWNKKDYFSLCTAVKNNNFKLLSNYFKAVELVQSVLPHCAEKNKKTQFDSLIAWAINLDTFEVHTQQELIPNGFKL